jgi:hypothetical protein
LAWKRAVREPIVSARRVGAVLVAAVKEHDWSVPCLEVVELAAQVPAERLVAAAEYHRVVGCVLASVRGAPDAPSALVEALETAARRTSGRTLLASAAVRMLRPALGDDLPWVVLKGPVLDAAFYRRPRLRTFTDVDVLVAPRHLGETVERLEAAGFEVADRNWRLMYERVAGEVHLQRAGCAPVDLHWTLLFNETMRNVFRFDTAAMLERSRVVEVADGPVRTFDNEDTLLHLAVHGALEGGDRLVWLKDLDVTMRAGVVWDELIERAHAFGVHLPVATMLGRARRVLDSPVPLDALAALAPRGWRFAARAADALSPPERSHGLGSPATLLARSARADASTTARVAFGGLARRAAGVWRGEFRRSDHRADPTHPGSLLHGSGDPDDRDAYFALIAATDIGRDRAD